MRLTGIRRPHRAAELRQAAAVAGEDHFHQGRTAGRLTDFTDLHLQFSFETCKITR